MKRRLVCPLAFSFAALLLASPPAIQAWDEAGHMLVTQIAWNQSSPVVRARAAELAAGLPNQFNGGNAYHFVTAGAWMDDMRSLPGYAWKKWHYVNIPWTADGSGFALPAGASASKPNIVWALRESIAKLRSPDTAPAERTDAFGAVMHLVGDIHQPMHATERRDAGGNGYLIFGVPFTDLWPGTKPNLHAFWDKAYRFDGRGAEIVQQWVAPSIPILPKQAGAPDRPAAPDQGVIAEEAAKIAQRFPAAAFPELANPTEPEAWARESHLLGCKAGYPPSEPAPDTAVNPIPPDFAHVANDVANRRIALAGYRLARLLGEIFNASGSAAGATR